MSKLSWFAVVLIFLLSLAADAECSSEEMLQTIASNQYEQAKAIRDVKAILTSNSLDCYTVQPSKQAALVSALLCKLIISTK